MTYKENKTRPRVKAIIFDMDNTLFDFVAAKQHACREVAKFLGRDDWEALFSCFLNSPHGFESHENIKDYFDLCGLLEECSSRKSSDEPEEKPSNLPEAPAPSPAQDVLKETFPPERENVVRIQISQVTKSPPKSAPHGTSPSDARSDDRQVSVPSACAIPLNKESIRQSPLKALRDNLLVDKSLYCNEVFSRCCTLYETEKVRVLEPYPQVPETLGELRRRGFPMAVLTDAHNGNALARLRKVDLARFFDHVISFDMTGAKKPAPDAFLLALKKLGTLPSETLLVGDSIRRDIAPAQALGMITAYAAYGDRNVPTTTPTPCRPDYVLTGIEELVRLV
jgi:putative hydrolase of the HAD superfamily